MKQLIGLLLKIGIPVAIIYAAHTSNPDPQTHQAAIIAKNKSLQDGDVLGKLDTMMHASTERAEIRDDMIYHNFFLCSKVTLLDGKTASYGFFNRVFVTKSEL